MFTGELDNLARSWRPQRAAFVIGSTIAVAVAAAPISARFIQFLYPAVVFVWLAVRWRAVGRGDVTPPLDGPVLAFGGFLGWALVSTTWAEEPLRSLQKVPMAILILLATATLARLAAGEPRKTILRLAEGLWIGVAIGLVYYCAEQLSAQSLKIWLYNTFSIDPGTLQPERYFRLRKGKIIQIASNSMTRNAAPISLLLWPAMMAALGSIVRPWNRVVAVVLLLLAVAAAFLSPHETTKVALPVGFLTLCVAFASTKWAYRMLAAGWIIACLAVVPAVRLLYQMDLHNAAWLPRSAQHRVIIWNFTAEHAMHAPIVGTGANMTYVLGPRLTATAVTAPTEKLKRKMSRHAHNAYLQVWFELGVVGASLLTLAGLVLLSSLKSMSPCTRPFAFATFASASTVAASSYGMWQAWFLCMFGLAAVALAVAARAFETRPVETTDPTSRSGDPDPGTSGSLKDCRASQAAPEAAG